MVVETAEAQSVAEEEATGVLCADMTVHAGPVHPPACTPAAAGRKIKEIADLNLVTSLLYLCLMLAQLEISCKIVHSFVRKAYCRV